MNSEIKKTKVYIIPFFEGRKESFKEHTCFLNELGFDVHYINLNCCNLKSLLAHKDKTPFLDVWKNDIFQILKFETKPFFILSCSLPTLAALQVLKEVEFKNFRGLVCEGGPFFPTAWRSGWKLFRQFYQLSLIKTVLTLLKVSKHFKIPKHYKSIKSNLYFKTLCFIDEKDQLVLPQEITHALTKTLDTSKQSVTYVRLKNSKHNRGVKDDPESFRKNIKKFLDECLSKSTRENFT